MVSMDRGQRVWLGDAARARVIEKYSIDAVARRYEDLYSSLAGRSAALHG
jgi:hypothetical protein